MSFDFNKYSLKELYEKFNVVQVGFHPFDDFDPWENEEDRLSALEDLKYSTVYKGIRYYFKTPKDLKNFCEMVEGQK